MHSRTKQESSAAASLKVTDRAPNAASDLSQEAQEELKTRSFEELLAEIHAVVPEEDWDTLPADLSENHDRYIYGIP
jgi:hypothetical protein